MDLADTRSMGRSYQEYRRVIQEHRVSLEGSPKLSIDSQAHWYQRQRDNGRHDIGSRLRAAERIDKLLGHESPLESIIDDPGRERDTPVLALIQVINNLGGAQSVKALLAQNVDNRISQAECPNQEQLRG